MERKISITKTKRFWKVEHEGKKYYFIYRTNCFAFAQGILSATKIGGTK